MKRILSGVIVVIIVGLFSPVLMAQEGTSLVLDGIYEKKIHKEREIIPYDHLRESDVFYAKRIWRVIDIREKMNLPFAYPKEPFIQILLEAAYAGEINVYAPPGDEFKVPMTPDEVKGIGASKDTILVTDPVTLEEVQTIVEQELDLDKIRKFRLKEDWVFDEETSTYICRIIGISPILDRYDENGNYQGELPMFWAYYPELRKILINKQAFNPFNDAHRLTWEDVFEARMFSSYIFKESNVYDQRIQDYATGIDGLLESERIRHYLYEKEHNLWSF